MKTATVEAAELCGQATLRIVHYGASRYRPATFAPIADSHFVKPRGGLWTSPVDSEFGWKDWCKSEEFAKGERDTRHTLPRNLYGWDCETVLVINKDCLTTP